MFKKKTLFDNVSVIEAKPIIESMIDDFITIISNDNMSKAIKDCFGELKLPEGKTPKQFFNEINGNARIANFLKAVMGYAYEPLIAILSKLFCVPYEKYCKKSINEISKDLIRFAKSPFFGFFMSAIMSAKVR
jgi:hypothetical protein